MTKKRVCKMRSIGWGENKKHVYEEIMEVMDEENKHNMEEERNRR